MHAKRRSKSTGPGTLFVNVLGASKRHWAKATQSCRDNQSVEVSVQNFSCQPRRIIHLNNKGERKTARPGLPGMIEKRLPYNHIEWRKHVIKSTLSGLYSTLLYNGFTAYGTCKSSRILLSEVPYLVTISYGAFKALRLRLSLAGGEASSSCRVLSPHDHTYSSLYTRVRCINYSHGLPWHQNAPKISKVKPQNDLHFISIL